MTVVERWTGRETRLLRHALRSTVRDFAEDLGVDPRTITKWESGGAGHQPRPELQRALDTMLARATDSDQERFFAAGGGTRGSESNATHPLERPMSSSAPIDARIDTLVSLLSGAAAAGLGRAEPEPKGVFLPPGPLTIVVPLKREDRDARPVVAAEDVTASHRLADLARSIGVAEVSVEQIPLDGSLDLNRTGLIVICGPRVSPDVADLLAQDRRLSFQHRGGAWELHDNDSGIHYRSGQDRKPEEPVDYAYLSRTTRPDGRGNLLLFTGIHPAGTLGVIRLLTRDLAYLHDLTGQRNFSAVFRVEYDRLTAEPVSVTMIGQPRWQDGA
jgi:transcriptional regulator with XRE-family HTH domain